MMGKALSTLLAPHCTEHSPVDVNHSHLGSNGLPVLSRPSGTIAAQPKLGHDDPIKKRL
jgi:hypothetical protein